MMYFKTKRFLPCMTFSSGLSYSIAYNSLRTRKTIYCKTRMDIKCFDRDYISYLIELSMKQVYKLGAMPPIIS